MLRFVRTPCVGFEYEQQRLRDIFTSQREPSMLKQRFVLILFACLTVVGLVTCGTSGMSGSTSDGTPGSAKGSTPTVLASPTHAATTPSSSSPFRVTSIDMAVNPASIAGMACGQSITVSYMAM